ncbi:hypothetical protein [Prevotella sp. OH937_COT-195]|uniref:hypothetical protein n=1 Tax=Prevotella sp. OH937_COT-195 TaxID=2491051 RepID=UPI000F652E41|nr:hypothetical protein [Prevotella sp. OH937_COT-195]RRD02780.1 hypothetical protein EII32_01875 [Prevotella sp. OH937_COT-195]
MKNFLFCFVLIFTFIPTEAKTTYIPTYINRLILLEEGGGDSVENIRSALNMLSSDGSVGFTIAQQIVTKDLVRLIKRAKSESGWALVASLQSSAYNIFRQKNSRNIERP